MLWHLNFLQRNGTTIVEVHAMMFVGLFAYLKYFEIITKIWANRKLLLKIREFFKITEQPLNDNKYLISRIYNNQDIFYMIDCQDHIKIKKVQTKPYGDQKPGTSGLRKKVKIYQQEHYTENFIQSYFNALRKDTLSPKVSLLVGGDGRYFSKQSVQIILAIACANGVDEVHVAKNLLMSTPACSAYIRNLNKQFGNCIGGILLTASHNPGGPDQDFGVKFNSRNGGPALEQFTNSIFVQTKKITEYRVADFKFSSIINFNTIGQYQFTHVQRIDKPVFTVKVVENVAHYIALMEQQFDFEGIRKLFARSDFKFVFDGMYGAAGPYAKALFAESFKGNITLQNCDNKQDFNHHHPDPNLKCAEQLVKLLGVFSEQKSQYDFGAACDGDADRNMILGKNFFITPSDSLAILAAHSDLFLKQKIRGVARSMPTSGAVDKVAQKLGVKLYQTPTGWKFFGNLMEEGLISLCGQQSFGTGSFHVRQKDGLWTILAWLQVLAKLNEHTQVGKLKGIKQICQDFWKTYGRNYYCRYDYENCKTQKADKVWEKLEGLVKNSKQGSQIHGINFGYVDPVDKSQSLNQGLIFKYKDGRVIFRKSGTGSEGTTLRVYFERYDNKVIHLKTADALKDIIQFGLKISEIQPLTDKKEPDVVT